ncbi:hypothetical protein AAHC03_026519 [Spirometra sp. Aus1]
MHDHHNSLEILAKLYCTGTGRADAARNASTLPPRTEENQSLPLPYRYTTPKHRTRSVPDPISLVSLHVPHGHKARPNA